MADSLALVPLCYIRLIETIMACGEEKHIIFCCETILRRAEQFTLLLRLGRLHNRVTVDKRSTCGRIFIKIDNAYGSGCGNFFLNGEKCLE